MAPPGLRGGAEPEDGAAVEVDAEEALAAARANFFLACKEGRLDDAKSLLASSSDMDVNMTDAVRGCPRSPERRGPVVALWHSIPQPCPSIPLCACAALKVRICYLLWVIHSAGHVSIADAVNFSLSLPKAQ